MKNFYPIQKKILFETPKYKPHGKLLAGNSLTYFPNETADGKSGTAPFIAKYLSRDKSVRDLWWSDSCAAENHGEALEWALNMFTYKMRRCESIHTAVRSP